MTRSQLTASRNYLTTRISLIFFLISILFLLFGQANAAELTLAWDASTNTDVSVYRVYYGTQSNSYTTTACEGPELTCTISGLTAGQRYYFAATAINSYGESTYSEEITYTIPAPPTTYTINASAGSNGSISPSGTVSVTAGTSRSFAITPNSGYVVADVRVNNTSVGAVPSYTFSNVRSNQTIAASFTAVTPTTYTINASAGSNGSISPSGTVSVTAGTSRSFAITPNSGYVVADVRVNNTSVGAVPSYTFSNVRSNQTIAASFTAVTPTTYTINASAGSNGSISPSGTVSVTAGTSRSFAITPNSGYVVADVRVNNTSVGAVPSYTFSNVRSNQTIAASFTAVTPTTYTINASAGSNGSISPSGTVSVTAGTSRSFAITPNSGYVVADVRVNNTSVGAVPSYTFSNVRSNQAIAASFTAVTPTTYTINASTGSNGSISPSGTVSVTAGTSRSFAITPNSGYVVADVRVNNTSVGAVPSYTFSNVRSNQAITASFVIPADNLAPDQPTLMYPADRETGVDLTPLLEIVGFSDPDVDDGHAATRWQIATDSGFDNLVLDINCDADSTNNYLVNLLVPQGTLSSQTLYFWRAMVLDNRNPNALWSVWSPIYRFTTTDPVQPDINANGVPDDVEPETSDLDADGRNDNDQPLMRVFAVENEGYQIGIKAVDGVDTINYFAHIDPANMPDAPEPPVLPYGLMNLNLQLTEIGGTARIEIYTPEAPDNQSRWFKYDPVNGWYEYPVVIEGDKYILELFDGGSGDADGIANGIIVDPIGMSPDVAGISVDGPASQVSGGGGGGGGGCFILAAAHGRFSVHLLAVLLMGTLLGGCMALMRKH